MRLHDTGGGTTDRRTLGEGIEHLVQHGHATSGTEDLEILVKAHHYYKKRLIVTF
jgi:hypothetical protein